jgi:hypothetical protein
MLLWTMNPKKNLVNSKFRFLHRRSQFYPKKRQLQVVMFIKQLNQTVIQSLKLTLGEVLLMVSLVNKVEEFILSFQKMLKLHLNNIESPQRNLTMKLNQALKLPQSEILKAKCQINSNK